MKIINGEGQFEVYYFQKGLFSYWFLYKMVAHFTMRTYGVNQAFQFIEGIWLHRKESNPGFISNKANCTSYARNMF